MQRNTALLLLLTASFAPAVAFGGPLTEARVTKVVNIVKLIDPSKGDRDAKLDDVVRDDLALTTGIKSRSELLFQDNTLTRLGPESFFSFKTGTRDMTLQKGTMLLQVPKGIGGAKIHTAAVTAAITGTTIMMEYHPQKSLKVLVLEGSLRLSNGRFGDSLLLTPGKMVIMNPNDKRIPDPVTVDLKKVVKTSTLVNMGQGKKGKNEVPLPSAQLIEHEVDVQQRGKDGHHLIETNLVIPGGGTNVLIASDDLMNDLSLRNDVEKTMMPDPTPRPVAAPTAAPTPNLNPTPNPNPPPFGSPTPPAAGPYLIDNTTTVTTANSGPTISTQGVTSNGVIYSNLTTNGSPAAFLFGAASPFDNEFDFDNSFLADFQGSAVYTFDSLQLGGGITFQTGGGANRVVMIGDSGITNTAGATVNLGGIDDILFATNAGSIALDSGVSFVGSPDGTKPNLLQFYARGGDVNIGSMFSLTNSTIQFAAENNALFDTHATFNVKNLAITGLQSVQFLGTANVNQLFQLNGGALELGGTVNAQSAYLYGNAAVFDGTFTGKSFTVDVAGSFTMNGSVSLRNDGLLQLTAGDMIFGANVALSGTKGELSVIGGNLDATGHSLTGFDQISLDTGNLVAGTLTAKTIAVGGTLAGGSMTAETITANALNVDHITASKTLTVNTADLAPYQSGTISINTPSLFLPAGATLNGTDGTNVVAPGGASNLAITTRNFTLATSLNLNGGDADVSVSDAGGNGGKLDLTDGGTLTVNAPISATTGQNSNSAMTGGNGGTVNLTAQNTVKLNNKIEVSSNDGNRRRSNAGGNINVTSKATGGTAIAVSSSAQLLALLDSAATGPGGSIKFVSAGGAINMSGTAQADRGTIDIRNNGNGTVSPGGTVNGGAITLANVTLAADTVKVGALGTNGTLTIGGGTISADTAIKLYAGGSNGKVNFIDNVTLNGNSVKTIAGDTVTIFNGKVVTVNGPSAANVFTNHANYTGFGGNGSTTGTWAGKGATTQPLNLAPGF